MIGYTIPVKVWSGHNDDPKYETAILSLDIDDPDNPVLDVRLASGDVILNCAVEDAYNAAYEIRSTLNTWQRDRERGEVTA